MKCDKCGHEVVAGQMYMMSETPVDVEKGEVVREDIQDRETTFICEACRNDHWIDEDEEDEE